MLRSLLHRRRVRNPAPAIATARTPRSHLVRHPSYLTDGRELYRSLGSVRDGIEGLLALENCRSLQLTLVPAAELAGRYLRAVTPSIATTERT